MAEEEEWRGTCARLAEILAQDAGDTDEEAPLLERFTQAHAEEYTFGEEEHGRLLQALVHHRLHHQAFVHSGQHDALLRVLQALRVLLRDEALMASFTSLCDLRTFAQLTFSLVEQHLSSEPLSFSTECLVECTSILKKLTLFSRPSWPSLLREQCHVVLARLLRTSEGTLLPQALFILMELTSDNSFHSAFESIKLNESLLHIVQHHDVSFKRLAATILRNITRWSSHRCDFVDAGGIRCMLPMLHSNDDALVNSAANTLNNACQDSRSNAEIRRMGGIPLTLSLLRSSSDNDQEPNTSFRCLCAACSLLATLASDDESASLICKHNGVYLLGRLLILSEETFPNTDVPLHQLRCQALRAMRILFSLERNRKLFKLLFPPDMFGEFIDIGHYVYSLESYDELAASMEQLSEDATERMQMALDELNAFKQNSHRLVRDYALIGKLGSGAYGFVWQACKENQERHFAIKELLLTSISVPGQIDDNNEKKMQAVEHEVEILATLDHPNIVRYYESFRYDSSFYIVMELVEGVSLTECINSSKEKNKPLEESLIWHVLIQTLQALSYLHNTKEVIHRDLTPGNIMLEQSQRNVKITDFGLSEWKEPNHGMQSAVGTLSYNCPEIVQHQQYSDKADLWSVGCILYHLIALKPPFNDENPLVLANSIVEGNFKPLRASLDCSERLVNVVHSLLTPSPEARPAASSLASMIAPELICALDRLSVEQDHLLESLTEERMRRRKQNAQALHTEEAYKTLLASRSKQEHASVNSSPPTSTATSAAFEQPVEHSADSQAQTMGLTLPVFRHDSNRDGTEGYASAKHSWSGGKTIAHSGGHSSFAARKLAPSKLHISSSKLKPLTEPYAELLSQLHKLVFAEQLPPSVGRDKRRRCIERYKRALFSARKSPGELKSEVVKLARGSMESIPVDFGLQGARAEPSTLQYADLHQLLEEVLCEFSYYDN